MFSSRRNAAKVLACMLAVACHSEPSPGPTAMPLLSAVGTSGQLGGPLVVLRGTVITPDGVIEHGYVAMSGGRIVSVTDKLPESAEAVTINTEGIILPGFVDLHNHVPWNVLPRWSPGRTFTNRDEWAADATYQRVVVTPFNRLLPSYFCDMNAWGELRALVGGTTSILATRQVSCIHGLVRNLDYNSGFYGTTELNREHVYNVLRLPSASDTAARAAFVAAARYIIANSLYEGLVMHVAEGTDAVAEEEFTFLQSQSLLNPKGVLIHGLSLSASDFQVMADAGAALVWSPRSNLELYGTTADIAAAMEAGVEVALAPDWAVTGSSNMLDELKTADAWNRARLGGRLSDRQLVDMVTAVPARIAGVEDEVGAVLPGLRADLLVIRGDHNDPWRAVIDASLGDVDAVFIGGTPLYGRRQLMERFWDSIQLEDVVVEGEVHSLASAAAGINVAGIAARLLPVLQREGTSLAPLAER